MKLEPQSRPRKVRASEILGQEAQAPEVFFDVRRDVPREDLQDWKDSLAKSYNENSAVKRIQVFSAVKLLDFFPEEVERFRACPWLKEAWITYFKNFFKTLDYNSNKLGETARAYKTAVDFMKVFPEARVELLAGRDEENDFQLLLQSISNHPFNIQYLSTMLQFWPDRRAEILQSTDPSLALADIRRYPGRLGTAVPVLLVFPEYRRELGELVVGELEWKVLLNQAREEAREKYYEIPRYYELVQQLQLLASPDAHLDEQGKLVVRPVRGLGQRPGLPVRPEV